ncbi:nascent polypeptide-associated complex subunit beta-like [Magnolia sinica]|uniref:nascent polypeptide-associated complex subunit beta-like n=1 Tax=Magnolia sinica TaxID=86752 RepID=UPI0026584FA0|nr:nascent polypeptide-associated complex subunit beta-like [Magnolia sinica]
MNWEKLMKMASAVRTSGKGSMRRKKKAVHKTTTTDDKRLQSTLKRIGVNAIPAIEEVNIFKDDVVIQFQNPKVQASIAANTWVVSGSPQTKKLQDLLPRIINQLGPDNLDNLRKLAEQFQKQAPGVVPTEADDDDDVPELVPGETFEATANDGKASQEFSMEFLFFIFTYLVKFLLLLLEILKKKGRYFGVVRNHGRVSTVQFNGSDLRFGSMVRIGSTEP